MKQIVFITVLLISISASAQVDSIARVKKPVLRFLIGEHYRAEELAAENDILRKQKNELSFQIVNQQKIFISMRKDSILCDSLISLNKRTALSWKSSYESEKKDHKDTRRKVIKWKLITVIAIGIGLYGLIQN